MKWTTFACAMALGCGGGGGGDDTVQDSGPEDAGPEPSKCSTVAGPITVSTRAAAWAAEDGDAVWPAIVSAGDRVYVAWYTEAPEDPPGSTEHVWLAQLDTTGNRQGDIVEVGAGGRAPALGASGSTVAIAWREVGIDVHAAHVAIVGDGPTLTAGAVLEGAEPQTTPSIVGASSGDGFGVALIADPSDLWFYRLDGAGMIAGTPPVDPIMEATVFAKPSAVPTPDGFVVVFGLASGFRAAVLDDAGVLQGNPTVVADQNDAPCNEGTCKEYLSTMPAILGGDLVYHFNDDGDLLTSPDHSFFGRGIGFDGNASIPSRTILSAHPPARNPAAAWTGEGIAVVWADGRSADSKLQAALLDAELQPLGGAGDVAAQRGDEEYPAIVWLGSEGMVAFASGEPPQRVIKVQRITCEQ